MLPHKETNDVAWAAVMSAVKVPLLVRQLVVSSLKVLQTLLIEGTDRFGQVTISLWVAQIKHLTLVVLDDPWEDRVLCQIQRATLRIRVQDLEVLEVRDGSLHPLVRVDLYVR